MNREAVAEAWAQYIRETHGKRRGEQLATRVSMGDDPGRARTIWLGLSVAGVMGILLLTQRKRRRPWLR